MTRAVLHIGLPKTGTCYVQSSIVQNRDALAGAGVEVLNVSGRSQHHAAWDLLGRRIGGADPTRVNGAWTDLTGRAGRSSQPCVLWSDEFLVHARPAHVRTLTRSLHPRELQVVISVRDLRGAITSMWEQNTAKGRTITWSEYVAAVRDPASGPPTSGVAFWLRYDVRRILGAWSGSIPADCFRIVVVPGPGAPAPLLMERFARAADIDVSRCRPQERHVHTSIGAVQVEVLRRLNADLRERLTEAQYLRVVADLIRPASAGLSTSGVLAFPSQHRAWVEDTSAQLIDWLASGPYAVIGDLDDLRPTFDGQPEVSPEDLGEDVIREVTRDLLVGTLAAYGSDPSRKRRRRDAPATRSRGSLTWSSRLRTLTFRARVAALERADRSRFLARAATTYLRRTGGAR